MRVLGFILSAILLMLASCADKKNEWLKQYAQTKCAYQTEQDIIKADSIEQVSSLVADRLKLQEQLSIIAAPFEKKIVELNEEVKKVKREYMKSYRMAEEAQNAKFGHQNTPAYEKEINRLDNIKQTKTFTLERKISEVKSELENSKDYISITKKIRSQDEKIITTKESIITNHKVVIDSLQELLNVENSNFARIKSELDPKEQKTLELKRDSIRVNPCK
jgi:hypothetical protein